MASSLSVVLAGSAALAIAPDARWYNLTMDPCYVSEEDIVLTYDGGLFSFLQPKTFSVRHTADGYHVVDSDLAIDLYATSLQELQQDLDFVLEDNYVNYASAPDAELASDGLRLKRNMKKLIKNA